MIDPEEFIRTYDDPALSGWSSGKRSPMARPVLSPKFHGAWLGAATGINVGSIVVGLIETYLTHKALPVSLIDAIDTITGGLVAALGAYVMPLLAGLKTSELLAAVRVQAAQPAPVPYQATAANVPANVTGTGTPPA